MFSSLVSPRLKATSLNPFVTGSGTTKSSLQLLGPLKSENQPTATYAMQQFISADPSGIVHTNTPHHWHVTQAEKFTTEQETPRISLQAPAKDVGRKTIAIRSGQYHTFANASAVDPLQVMVSVDAVPGEDKADEVFFRNLYSYLDGCERNRNGPPPLQMLLFMTSADSHLSLPAIQRGISRMVGFFSGAVTGGWFLGFRRSYPKYVDGVELEDMKELREK